LRPDLMVKGLIELGVAGFGLHPSLQALMPFWKEGSLAIVHAVGSPDPTRSHFDGQDFLELGTPGVKSTPDGWLARALREMVIPERTPLDAIAVSPRLPRALQGVPDAIAFASLDQLRLRPLAGARGPAARSQSRAAFESLYSEDPSGKEAFAAVEMREKKL